MDAGEVASCWPYGLKYHAAMKDAAASASFLGRLPQGVSGRVITPSLEDVFIRLVEGAQR
jgi:hypothetical protein